MMSSCKSSSPEQPVTSFMKTQLRYWHNRPQMCDGCFKEVTNNGKCRWNYMPFKHVVPDSSPGGSNMRSHSSMVEHAFHQFLSSHFALLVQGTSGRANQDRY